MGTRNTLTSLLLLGLMAPTTFAATGLAVDLGWQGIFRPSRWGPVYITASDTTPRSARIEVYSGHDQMHAMVVHQTVALNPSPTTYVMYLPMQNWGSELSVILRDSRTDRRLAEWNLAESRSDLHFEPAEQLVGITGRAGADRLLGLQFGSPEIRPASVAPLYLPAVAIGYDGFNVLMLNQPDLAQISADQQEAIVDWVRAGGHVICWFSDQPLPGSSPILDALPAMVGENVVVELSDDNLARAGLADRFRRLKGRTLMPSPGAKEIPLFGDSASAWRRPLGLGSITLLPVDVSTLMFNSPEQGREFWEPLLSGIVQFKKEAPAGTPNVTTYTPPPDQSFASQRFAQASEEAMNLLGDVPGAADFGFSYVALVMVGMMLLVGPIDWIVLKRLGRQPWTWVTTGGWIALITVGAVYIGYFVKSGDLRFNTLRLIDQVGDLQIASVDAAGIYSPRTREYTMNVDPSGWWEPLAFGTTYYSNHRSLINLPFHQDYQGNRPEPMLINVWSLRFFKSEIISPSAPLLQASLHREKRDPGREYLVGTITNVGAVPLKNLCFRIGTSRGAIDGKSLAPGASLEVNSPIAHERTGPPVDERFAAYRFTRSGSIGPEIVFDLATDRSIAIDRLFDSGEPYVCLFAELEAPPAHPTLSPTPTIEKHQQYVRAVIPLDAGK